jgi:hypothetical protein
MTVTPRFIAASAVASILLSATPAAAHGFQFGTDTNVNTSVHTQVADVDSHVKVKTETDGGFKNFGQFVRSFRTESKTESNAEMTTEQKVSLYTRWKDAAAARVKAAINTVGSLAKRICQVKNGTDQNAITACLNTAKAEFSASVTAMIDAAFKM